MPQRLPIVDGDDGTWGTILNQYLSKEHYDDGTDNAANGGHKTVTIRAGTAAAGTAPLKLTAGTLLTTPEAGAVEFAGNQLYFTQPTGTTRKIVATVPSTGTTGELYYRDSVGSLTPVTAGSDRDVLRLSSGLPVWEQPLARNTVTAVFGDSVNTGSIAAGTVCYVTVPFSGTLTRWSIVAAGASAACVIDVWKRNAAMPTVAHTIDASAKPTLISGDAGYKASTTLTGWTTSVAVGDVFAFKLDSVSGSVTSITLTLGVLN